VKFLFPRKKINGSRTHNIIFIFFYVYDTQPKEKGRKITKLKNQNHKNQAGQQYTKYYGLWKIIMSYGKNESNKKETIEKNRKKEKRSHVHMEMEGDTRGVEIRNVDT
jgi:2-phosphoglycerate kinase